MYKDIYKSIIIVYCLHFFCSLMSLLRTYTLPPLPLIQLLQQTNGSQVLTENLSEFQSRWGNSLITFCCFHFTNLLTFPVDVKLCLCQYSSMFICTSLWVLPPLLIGSFSLDILCSQTSHRWTCLYLTRYLT